MNSRFKQFFVYNILKTFHVTHVYEFLKLLVTPKNVTTLPCQIEKSFSTTNRPGHSQSKADMSQLNLPHGSNN